jgi:hypothetical protein
MKTQYFLVILLSLAIATMTGCRTNPVYNVQDQHITTNIDNHTEEDVKKAIVRAGGTLGWNMKADKPGHVLGTLYLRKHIAIVDITYDLNKYSITYKDSTNLDYEAAGAQTTDADGNTYVNETAIIHSNYNGWIQNLDRAIQTQLSTL